MEDCRNSNPNTVGFCLLPTELIQNILLHLALPEINHMKLINKHVSSAISDRNFVRECNFRSESTSWIFVYMKRSSREAVLHGFPGGSDRWFKVSVARFLKRVVFPGEDLYFLTASGNFFLFASNSQRVVIAVNLVSKTSRKIPPCPLGPRGTSSWRRSGMRLVAASDRFWFLFTEMVGNWPVLFEYDSKTDTWRSTEAGEKGDGWRNVERGGMFLSVANGPHESVVIAVGATGDARPVVLRPRLIGGGTAGHGMGESTKKLRVYGDGYMAAVRSDGYEGGITRKVIRIDLWGISADGDMWEFVSEVPNGLMEKINSKTYGVMMGCLEVRVGIIRLVLMSNREGLWDIIWLNFDKSKNYWEWVSLPDCNFMKGLNMAGVTFSSGLTLS